MLSSSSGQLSSVYQISISFTIRLPTQRRRGKLINTLNNAGLFEPKFRSNLDKPKCWVKNVISNFNPTFTFNCTSFNLILTQHLGLSIFDPNLGWNNPAFFRVYTTVVCTVNAWYPWFSYWIIFYIKKCHFTYHVCSQVDAENGDCAQR